MFEQSSRYTNCENAQLILTDGRIINYKKRRFLPQSEKLSILQEVQVMSGDRLDLIAARIVGDPEKFWHICDSNDAMNPMNLAEVGKTLKIASMW